MDILGIASHAYSATLQTLPVTLEHVCSVSTFTRLASRPRRFRETRLGNDSDFGGARVLPSLAARLHHSLEGGGDNGREAEKE